MRRDLAGVTIGLGPMDWQILQRRLDNKVDIRLGGTWKAGDENPHAPPPQVEVRIVEEISNRPVTVELDWHYADATRPEGTWETTLRNVPAGGLYRIETRLQHAGYEWRHTGDSIHHIGVGDLWVIAGQSNAVGYGHGSVEDPPELGVHVFRPSEVWEIADHPLADPRQTRHPKSFHSGWVDHSPWIAFGRILRRTLGIPIGLIPCARGASGLHEWEPQKIGPVDWARLGDLLAGFEALGLGSDRGFLYYNMLSLIGVATAYRDYSRFDPRDGGPVFATSLGGETPRIAGVLWYQGCHETGYDQLASSYLENFKRLVEGLRAALDAPSLPFITCQLNRVYEGGASDERWAMVREQQRRAPWVISNVAVIPTLDLDDLSDHIHNGVRANLVIAERAARAALGMVYGHSILWKAPEIAGAWFEDSDPLRVRLRFDHVAGELMTRGRPIEEFTIRGDHGGVGIRSAELVKPDGVRLILSREVGMGARVSCSAKAAPRPTIFDREGRPLLGFLDYPVVMPEKSQSQ